MASRIKTFHFIGIDRIERRALRMLALGVWEIDREVGSRGLWSVAQKRCCWFLVSRCSSRLWGGYGVILWRFVLMDGMGLQFKALFGLWSRIECCSDELRDIGRGMNASKSWDTCLPSTLLLVI